MNQNATLPCVVSPRGAMLSINKGRTLPLSQRSASISSNYQQISAIGDYQQSPITSNQQQQSINHQHHQSSTTLDTHHHHYRPSSSSSSASTINKMCTGPRKFVKKWFKNWRTTYFGDKRAPFEGDLRYTTRMNQDFVPELPNSMRGRPHPYGVAIIPTPTCAQIFDINEPPAVIKPGPYARRVATPAPHHRRRA